MDLSVSIGSLTLPSPLIAASGCFGYGVEYKVNDSLWLVLASITERGFVSGDKRSLISTGVRFGQSDKSLIGAPAQGK